MTSLEGWLDVMFSAMDITDRDKQPARNQNPAAALYFIAFISVVVFFIINIAIGVIVEKFNQTSGRGLLTEKQKQMKDTLLTVVTQYQPPPLQRPRVGLRSFFYNVPSPSICVTLLIPSICVTFLIPDVAGRAPSALRTFHHGSHRVQFCDDGMRIL